MQVYLNDRFSRHPWQQLYPYSLSAHYWVAPPANYGHVYPYLDVYANRGGGVWVSGAGYGIAGSAYLERASHQVRCIETWLGPNRYNYCPPHEWADENRPASNSSPMTGGELFGKSVPPPKPESVPPERPITAGQLAQPLAEPEALPAPPPRPPGQREF